MHRPNEPYTPKHVEFQQRLDVVLNDPNTPDATKYFIRITLLRQEERITALCRKQKAHIKNIREMQNATEYWKMRYELAKRQMLEQWNQRREEALAGSATKVSPLPTL